MDTHIVNNTVIMNILLANFAHNQNCFLRISYLLHFHNFWNGIPWLTNCSTFQTFSLHILYIPRTQKYSSFLRTHYFLQPPHLRVYYWRFSLCAPDSLMPPGTIALHTHVNALANWFVPLRFTQFTLCPFSFLTIVFMDPWLCPPLLKTGTCFPISFSTWSPTLTLGNISARVLDLQNPSHLFPWSPHLYNILFKYYSHVYTLDFVMTWNYSFWVITLDNYPYSNLRS